MSSFYQIVSQQADETEIDIKDFRRYHIHVFEDSKDSILIRHIKKANNDRYEEFEKTHLIPASNNNKILNKNACLMWMVYEDMKEVLGTYELRKKGLLKEVDEKLAQFWIEEFKKDIVDLWANGVNAVSSGYGIVIDYYRDWVVREKYTRIYSLGTTFEECIEYAKKNIDLLQGKEMPFNLMDVREKAEVILKVRN